VKIISLPPNKCQSVSRVCFKVLTIEPCVRASVDVLHPLIVYRQSSIRISGRYPVTAANQLSAQPIASPTSSTFLPEGRFSFARLCARSIGAEPYRVMLAKQSISSIESRTCLPDGGNLGLSFSIKKEKKRVPLSACDAARASSRSIIIEL